MLRRRKSKEQLWGVRAANPSWREGEQGSQLLLPQHWSPPPPSVLPRWAQGQSSEVEVRLLHGWAILKGSGARRVYGGVWERKADWEGGIGGSAMLGSKGLKCPGNELDGELTALCKPAGGIL